MTKNIALDHPWLDRSPLLLLDGYRFSERRRRDAEDVTPTRVAGARALIVRGAEAAAWFYGDEALRRRDAVPGLVAQPLFGPGAVHTLDGEHHAVRKHWFVDVLDAEAVRASTARLGTAWREEVSGWDGEVDVFERASAVLTRVAVERAGLAVDPRGWEPLRRDLVAMVDGFGAVAGPRHQRARAARARTQAWVVDQVRAARHGTEVSGLVRAVADLRDEDGRQVAAEVAATELLNVVRPQVAVAWLVAGGARALDEHPALRSALADGTLSPIDVAQEVRRTTPFVPLLAARAGRDTRWGDVKVPAGTLVVLDVWGTDHDPRSWARPEVFDPLRYARERVTAVNLVPQGGGSRERGHRCPGEDLTLAYLSVMLPELARSGAVVHEGRVSLRRMPPRPQCRAQVEQRR